MTKLILPEPMPPRPEPENVPEMVERIARIIWDAKLEAGGGGRTCTVWPACPEAAWCRATARAVIAAMREPTEAMLSEGQAMLRHSGAWTMYYAMLEEALK